MSTKSATGWVWTVIGLLALAFASMYVWSLASSMVSAKNDTEVVLGIGVILALIGGWITLAIVIAKKAKSQRRSGSKRIRTLAVLAFAMLSLANSGCTRVDPGHVGIKVNMYGSNKGVSEYPLVTGRVWYNLFTETVIEYPCFIQTAVWTANVHEGRALNEEISFNSVEGLVITGDISLSYQLAQEKVPAFYVKFRSDKIETFTHGYLRNVARDAFNEIASKMKVDDIYGNGKDEMLKKVRERINKEVSPYGISIEQFGFIGAPRLPENVINAINAKIKALQDAIRTENEIVTAKAQAEKDVAKADGEGRAKVMVAKGEAEANSMLSKSITPELIEWRRLQVAKDFVDQWDGHRPMVESGEGGGGFLMQLPSSISSAKPVERTHPKKE